MEIASKFKIGQLVKYLYTPNNSSHEIFLVIGMLFISPNTFTYSILDSDNLEFSILIDFNHIKIYNIDLKYLHKKVLICDEDKLILYKKQYCKICSIKGN